MGVPPRRSSNTSTSTPRSRAYSSTPELAERLQDEERRAGCNPAHAGPRARVVSVLREKRLEQFDNGGVADGKHDI